MSFPRLDETGLSTLVNKLADVIDDKYGNTDVEDLSDVEITNLQDGQVLKYNATLQKWVNKNDESGSGLKIGDITGATAVSSDGTKSVSITWTDPNDIEVGGIKLAEWAGTIVVRKAGSAPTNRNDGTIITTSTVRNQYSSNGYVDNTVDYDTTYYYRFFPYTVGNQYTDGSSVSVTPAREKISTPVVAGSLTYDGTEQTMTFTYDTTKVSISGDSAITAGTHIATASLIDAVNCEWSDNTFADKSIEWTIAKAKVSAPTVSSTLVYSGSEQTATVSSYDNTIIEVTGITGINAGTYTANMSLINDNYWWTDETTADKTQEWSISKANGGCTFSSNPAVLDTSHLSTTVTITNNTGDIGTPTSSDTTICTVSKSGNVLTITSANTKNGTVTISVPIASSDNYNATTASLTVNSSVLAIVTWGGGTDAQITAMLNAHYNGWINIYDYWKVGDERSVSLSAMAKEYSMMIAHPAQTVTMVLMNQGGKTLETAVGGKTTCAFIVGQKETLTGNSPLGSSNDVMTGWKTCQARQFCNVTYGNAFPSTLIGIFKKHLNVAANGKSTGTDTTTDRFALPSEKEVFGTVTYANATAEASNTQFKYYETAANRNKKSTDTSSTVYYAWWTRSHSTSSTYAWCYVATSNGTAAAQKSNSANASAYYFAPFGVI